MYKLLFAVMLAVLCFECVPSAEDKARDRCVLGILNDTQLKAATDKLGGATFRHNLCKEAVESEGVGGAYRQYVIRNVRTLLLQQAVRQTSW